MQSIWFLISCEAMNQIKLHTRDGDKDEHRWEKLVLACVGLGLNISMPTYLSYVNVYGAAFDRSVLGFMSFCIFASSVIVVGLQGVLDPQLDAKNAKFAYTCRITIGLFVAMGILFAVPFAKRVWHVYTLGVICGIFEGAAISSMNQLAAAIHPEMTKYVNTGLTCGPGVPAVLSAAIGFYHKNTSFETKVMFAWLPALVPLCASVVFVVATLVCQVEGFHQALCRIQSRAKASKLLPPADKESSCALPSCCRSVCWSWFEVDFLTCGIVQFLAHGLARGLFPFMTYFGDLTLAHFLVLNSFISELLGRLAAHACPLKMVGCPNKRGIPCLVMLTIVRILLGALLILHVFKHLVLGFSSVLAMTSMFYFLYGWVANEVQVVVVEMRSEEQRSEITWGMMLFNYTGQMMSLCVAVPVVVLAFGP